jgi:hypothetical protein
VHAKKKFATTAFLLGKRIRFMRKKTADYHVLQIRSLIFDCFKGSYIALEMPDTIFLFPPTCRGA